MNHPAIGYEPSLCCSCRSRSPSNVSMAVSNGHKKGPVWPSKSSAVDAHPVQSRCCFVSHIQMQPQNWEVEVISGCLSRTLPANMVLPVLLFCSICSIQGGEVILSGYEQLRTTVVNRSRHLSTLKFSNLKVFSATTAHLIPLIHKLRI